MYARRASLWSRFKITCRLVQKIGKFSRRMYFTMRSVSLLTLSIVAGFGGGGGLNVDVGGSGGFGFPGLGLLGGGFPGWGSPYIPITPLGALGGLKGTLIEGIF